MLVAGGLLTISLTATAKEAALFIGNFYSPSSLLKKLCKSHKVSAVRCNEKSESALASVFEREPTIIGVVMSYDDLKGKVTCTIHA